MQGYYIPTLGASWMGSSRYVGPTRSSTASVQPIPPYNESRAKEYLKKIFESTYEGLKKKLEERQHDFFPPQSIDDFILIALNHIKLLGQDRNLNRYQIRYLPSREGNAMIPSFRPGYRKYKVSHILEVAEPYYNKIINDYNEFKHIEGEKMMKGVRETEERAIREEEERIRAYHERIDPLVMGEIQRIYDAVFQWLKEKEIVMNRGKRVSLEPGEVAEIIHATPVSDRERYKELSKPYYDKFIKELERLGIKQNTIEGGKRKRKTRHSIKSRKAKRQTKRRV